MAAATKMTVFRAIFSRHGFLFILTVVGLFAINLVWLLPTIRNIRAAASVLALAVAERIGADINLSIEGAINDLNRAAEEIAFEPERKEIVLRRLLKHNASFRNVALAERNGQESFRFDQLKLITPEDLKDHANEASFYLALEGAASVSSVEISPELEPRVTLVAPVSRVGKVQKVILAELSLADLVLKVRAHGFGQGHIYLVDQDGFQIIHPEITEIIRRPNYSQREIVKKVIYDGRIADGLDPEDIYVNDAEVRTFTVGVPLTNVGWGLFVEQPRRQAFTGERQALTFASLTIILGVMITMIITWSNVQLGRLNARLNELLAENYASAKMLVQRDRELVAANDNLIRLNAELNEVAKVLIRRDKELTEANTRLEELDRVKSEFVSVAAHQLRTPLTGIRWAYNALLEKETGELNPEQKEIALKGLQASLAMIELINNLLNVARMEEGRFGFNFTRQAIAPIVERACHSLKSAAEEKGVKLSIAIPKARLPFLELDEERITMVVSNLVDNAVKYTAPGGEITVRLFSSPRTRTVTLEVKDTGIGIPANQIHRIFTKFFRADNAMFFKAMGSGLGLYVAKNIVERHGGTISVESVENKGSTFVVVLPVIK